MANLFYPLGKKHFAIGDVVWKASGGSTVRAFLVDSTAYTYSSTHEFLSDIPTNARKGASGGTAITDGVLLTLIDAATNGVLDADDITISGISAGSALQNVVIFKDGATDAASPLLLFIDTATGLPVTPDGNPILIQWDNGANKIGVL